MVEFVIGLGFVILGAVLLAAEAATPGFFIGAVGTAFLVMGVIAMAFGDDTLTTWWAPIIMIIAAVIGMAISVWFYKSLGTVQPPTTTVTESIVGKTGIVTRDTDPDHQTRGKVKVGSRVSNATKNRKERISKLLRMFADRREEIQEIGAGDIGATLGLK